ncbi:MAG: hypothetical protein SFZ24_10675 [Planctomycetota bacterium]|nr:hypothetical protein [Planctomycetota bacterium]
MNSGVLRWILLGGAFWGGGPLAAWLTEGIRDPRGGYWASLLYSDDPVRAVLQAVGAFAVALVFAVAGARWFSVRSGLFAAGLVLVWPAWTVGSMTGIIRGARETPVFRLLVLEGALVASMCALVAFAVARAAAIGRGADEPSAGEERDGGKRALACGAALVGGVVGAFVVARTALPGQAVAAGVCAGLLGALGGGLIERRLSAALVLPVVAVLACAGPALGAVVNGTDPVRDLYAGTLTPLARLTPLHWAAGVLLGVPIGSSWVAGLGKPAEAGKA